MYGLCKRIDDISQKFKRVIETFPSTLLKAAIYTGANVYMSQAWDIRQILIILSVHSGSPDID